MFDTKKYTHRQISEMKVLLFVIALGSVWLILYATRPTKVEPLKRDFSGINSYVKGGHCPDCQ